MACNGRALRATSSCICVGVTTATSASSSAISASHAAPLCHGRVGSRRSRKISTRALPAAAASSTAAAACRRKAAMAPSICLQVPRPAMVDATARVGTPFKAADLDLIGAAALRTDAKRAEDRLHRLQRLDCGDLRAPAPAPQRDLLLVGDVPTLRLRWPIQDRASKPNLARASRCDESCAGASCPCIACESQHERTSRQRSPI
jgi:hypothetical protein